MPGARTSAGSPHPYIPNTDEDRAEMLAAIGVASSDDLFADIPPQFRIDGLDLPAALPEMDLVAEMAALSQKNVVAGDGTASFLGGGAYRHFIPSTVGHIVGRSEYYTAYTPYQPEISQGTLQTMFELQSMVCELTGMDVANAGMYDGASALAEACLMACRVTGRSRVAIHASMNPDWTAVVRTYMFGPGIEIDIVDGPEVTNEHACLAVQQPAFVGTLGDVWALGEAAHSAGALYVTAVNPISLGMLVPPSDYGADIVVAEGACMGWPVNFGGPWLGLFACRDQYIRQLPGRIVGRTTDLDGKTGYALTLQTREQHIRRERATSNICTSQQLVGLAAVVYLATAGKQGLRTIAEACYHKAHYAAAAIGALDGCELADGGSFFNEFVVHCPMAPVEINRRLLAHDIIGGLDVSDQIDNGMLLCVTELNTRAEIDRLVVALGEVAK